MSDDLKAHYDEMFTENAGELYEPLAGIDLLAHNRRMYLLENIELPDLSDAVVVDYGVGSWGFGCIYPRLKQCRHAIGFDISEAALQRSAQVSAADADLAGKVVDYHVSLGYEMALPDDSVDVFFCGECIEHVEDTSAFLAEVYRVIKPGGIAIFTTPNGDPWIYRQLDVRWCVGFEHVALMDFDEFRRSLERFFEPVDYIGFNQSVFPGLDASIPTQLGEAWVRSCRDEPKDATSLIGVVRKGSAAKLAPSTVKIVNWTEAQIEGPSPEAMALLGNATGGMIRQPNKFLVPVPTNMSRANVIFWSHPWSGSASVRCGDQEHTANLYSHAGGCYRLTLDLIGGDMLEVFPLGQRDERASDDQIILYRVVFAAGPEGVE